MASDRLYYPIGRDDAGNLVSLPPEATPTDGWYWTDPEHTTVVQYIGGRFAHICSHELFVDSLADADAMRPALQRILEKVLVEPA